MEQPPNTAVLNGPCGVRVCVCVCACVCVRWGVAKEKWRKGLVVIATLFFKESPPFIFTMKTARETLNSVPRLRILL